LNPGDRGVWATDWAFFRMSIHPTSTDVRSYYNDLLKNKMLAYRLYGNDRIEQAARFFLDNIYKDSIIVDIGCGIGIATEIMARKASRGRVIGLDISNQNIWYANKTISTVNTSFYCLDVVRNSSDIKQIVGASVDIFTLCDVLEHIPDTDRPILLQKLAEIGSPNVKILLTIPSEFYQERLRLENPAELQIIDNTITAKILDSEAREAGFVLTYFRLVDVWNKAQYAHCTLQRAEALNRSVRKQVTIPRTNRLISFSRRMANKLYFGRHHQKRRQKKYIDDVFGSL
jgi:2-polyprenyl-3-methyl-5-hydroxy-6-metoxy-1,4-benzoquinol methylase